MSVYKAKLSYLRIAPRKVRLVADLIRSKDVVEAKHQLNFSPKRSAPAILKLLNSAVSNAQDAKEEIKEDDLFIKEILVNEGPKLKRYRARARGSAYEIQKKTSHITLTLSEKGPKKPQEADNKKQTKTKKQESKKTTKTKTKK